MRQKFATGSRVQGKVEGPASFRSRIGTVERYEPGSGYFISFDDGRREYAYAHWLEIATNRQKADSSASPS